jgi:hypothetical protein
VAVLEVVAVAEALRETHGNLAAVGRKFGVCRQAVHDFVHRRPDLLTIVKECREALTDDVENALFEQALSGEGWAVRFYLCCQARARGYTRLQEIDLRAKLEDRTAKDLSDEELDAVIRAGKTDEELGALVRVDRERVARAVAAAADERDPMGAADETQV